MANMAHCRFSNTLEDLRDCYEHMDDGDLSEYEMRAREQLIRLIEQIAYDYGEEEEAADARWNEMRRALQAPPDPERTKERIAWTHPGRLSSA
jgi:hypothetical protein